MLQEIGSLKSKLEASQSILQSKIRTGQNQFEYYQALEFGLKTSNNDLVSMEQRLVRMEQDSFLSADSLRSSTLNIEDFKFLLCTKKKALHLIETNLNTRLDLEDMLYDDMKTKLGGMRSFLHSLEERLTLLQGSTTKNLALWDNFEKKMRNVQNIAG